MNIRKYEPLDEDFIYHSWLSSVDYTIPGARDAIRLVIDNCVERGTILVATSELDADHILGWLSYDDSFGNDRVMLYVFVKKHLRNHGVGKLLVGEAFPDLYLGRECILAAFWSFWCQKFNLKKKWKLKYNSLFLPVIVDGIHAKAGALKGSGRQEEGVSEKASSVDNRA